MQNFPHHYNVTATAQVEGDVIVDSENLSSLATAPPAEFGGPGDRWSPETLLVAAVANCFVLSFRAIARASRLSWVSISCSVRGDLDRMDKVTEFTAFEVRAFLRIPSQTTQDKANRLLELAEKSCLITNSLKADTHLVSEIEVVKA